MREKDRRVRASPAHRQDRASAMENAAYLVNCPPWVFSVHFPYSGSLENITESLLVPRKP